MLSGELLKDQIISHDFLGNWDGFMSEQAVNNLIKYLNKEYGQEKKSKEISAILSDS